MSPLLSEQINCEMRSLISTQPGDIEAGFAKQLQDCERRGFMTTPGSYMELNPTTNHTRPAHVWQVLLQHSSLPEISQRLRWKTRTPIHLCRISWVAAGQFRQAIAKQMSAAIRTFHSGEASFVCLSPWKPQAYSAGSPLKSRNTIWTDFESVCDCEFTGFNRGFCCNTSDGSSALRRHQT